MDAFVGMITMFGFSWAPRNWALCNGQLLSISQNAALFSLISTTFGGDGSTNFALPDFRGRVPMHFGSGNGLSVRVAGQAFGSEATALGLLQLPAHTHSATVTATLNAETTTGNLRNPLNAMLATPPASAAIYATPVAADNKAMAPESITTTTQIGLAGGGQPFSNLQPTLVVNFCICTSGIFPSRN